MSEGEAGNDSSVVTAAWTWVPSAAYGAGRLVASKPSRAMNRLNAPNDVPASISGSVARITCRAISSNVWRSSAIR